MKRNHNTTKHITKTFVQEKRLFLKRRHIFKTLKKIILLKRYWELSVYYREKVLLKKVFRVPWLIRLQKTKEFFRARAIGEFVRRREGRVKEKVWGEVWY